MRRTYCKFRRVSQELIDHGAEHEQPEGVVHLPRQPGGGEGLGVLEERGLDQGDDDGGEAVADQDQGPGGNRAVQVWVADGLVIAEEAPHVGLPDQVEQEAGDGHNGDADEVHCGHTHQLPHSD